MMKRTIACLLTLVLCISLCGCKIGKSEAAKTVDEQIKQIGQVTLSSDETITAAEEAVEKLTEEDKQQLEYLEMLEAARKDYNDLVNQDKANKVIEKINQIGAVSLENISKITDAETAYESLPAEAKEKVTNYATLTAASEQITPLKEERLNQLLSGMRLEEDRVRGLKFYYPDAFRFYSNGSWAADLRCFVLPYLGMDNSSCWLRLIYNYTGDDWVFYKSVIFAIDGEQHYESFNYFDIVHDNESGDVWEYIDVEVTDSDVELLKKIANSNETIVRFQGDDYSHDYVIPATDKQAIKTVVEVYELSK